MRHAKSGWDDPALRDFDRPLNAKGERAALLMGKWMREAGLAFDQIIASPAARVTGTIELAAEGYGKRFDPVWERRVYLASSATLQDVLRDCDDVYDHILLVGHNPGMEDLVLDLSPEIAGELDRERQFEKFPTAAVARLTLEIEKWADIKEGCGSLSGFIRPRDLDPSLGPKFD